MEKKKQILSCIQPTGDMHYGNYFGAVKNWVDLQKEYDCIYGVVDYHAMTMPYDVKKLRTKIWDLIFNMVAVGIKAENIFIQSLIPEHAELSWILNCFCSYGQLTRMTQFKDKSADTEQLGKDFFISAGLLNYPVLQAADILIYNADYVPIGKDQEQHLELTRDIAHRFNTAVGREYFILPEPLYTETPKIRSTADPSRKMSKSAGEKHYINVFAEEARIRKQIRSAVTDTGQEQAGQMSEGVKNLFKLLKAADNMVLHDELEREYSKGTLKYVDLKEATAETLVALSHTFRENKQHLMENKRELKEKIKSSSRRIRKIAQNTIHEVKDLVGLLNVKF